MCRYKSRQPAKKNGRNIHVVKYPPPHDAWAYSSNLWVCTQQHIFAERSLEQARVDIHFWRVLYDDNLHPLIPQLPNLVLLRPHHDHIYSVVYDNCLCLLWPGNRPKSPSVFKLSIHSMPNNLRWLLLEQMFHNLTRLSLLDVLEQVLILSNFLRAHSWAYEIIAFAMARIPCQYERVIVPRDFYSQGRIDFVHTLLCIVTPYFFDWELSIWYELFFLPHSVYPLLIESWKFGLYFFLHIFITILWSFMILKHLETNHETYWIFLPYRCDLKIISNTFFLSTIKTKF